MSERSDTSPDSNVTKETTDLGGDRPREHLVEDRLGYAGFARALARTLRDGVPPDGIVLAIHGAWGSGKTSAVNMALDVLASEGSQAPAMVVVRFSPWWISEQENLVRAFFSELAAELKGKVSADLLGPLKAFGLRVSKAGDLVAAGLSLVPGGGIAGSAAKAALKMTSDALSEEMSLDTARHKLSEALRKESRRILVVIDDVDRLPENEARQIFRLVKSVGDLPNVTYLLVFDRLIADRVMGGAEIEGPSWLEKIVQGSFDLPAPHPSDLQRLLTDRIQTSLGREATPDLRRWLDVFHKAIAPWIRTPRDAVRLGNAFAMTWQSARDEVNFVDFVAIETMRVFAPGVFDLIRRNSALITGFDATYKPSAKPFAEQLLAASPPGKTALVKAMLSEVFPRLRAIWSNYHEQNALAWDKERRVCSPRRFPAYFTFSIGDDALSRADVDRIVASMPDRAAFREAATSLVAEKRRAGGFKTSVVLDEVGLASDRMTPAQAEQSALTLMIESHVFLTPEAKGGALGAPPTWQVYFALDALLKRLDQPSRERTLMEATRSNSPLQMMTFLVSAISGQHGQEDASEGRPLEDQWVDLEGLASLTNAVLGRIASASQAGELLNCSDLVHILFFWAKRAGDDCVRSWSNDQITTPNGALTLAAAFTSEMSVSAYGSYSSTTVPRVDRTGSSRILDIDALTTKLDALASDHPDDREIAAVRSNWVKGLGVTLQDAEPTVVL